MTGHAAASSASATTTRSLVGQAEASRHFVAGERVRGGQRGVADVRATGGGDQIGSGGAEDALARDGALLLAHEAGHARHDEGEQDDRGDVDDERSSPSSMTCSRAMTGAISDAQVSVTSRSGVRRGSRSGAARSRSRIDGCSAAAPHSR